MRKILLATLVIVFAIVHLYGQKGFINPAANYAKFMGYRYEIAQDKDGNQRGVTHLPDGQIVNAWDFYKGKVGNEFQYGARYGFDTETEFIRHNEFTEERSICVRTDSKGEELKIPTLELMEMNNEPLINQERKETINHHEGAQVDPNFAISKSLPSSFDWRNNNGHTYIGAVRDQGGCGSCYSFGAAAAAEGTYNYATGSTDANCADFSEAYIAWCLSTISPYSSHFSGCNGADYDYYELQALVDIGIIDESYFPYTDSDNQSCPSATSSAPKTTFESWNRVSCNDIDAIKTAIMTYGVVDAAVYVSTSFSNYSGGIFTDSYTTCSSTPCYNTPTNHAISLVGWGTDATTGDYWILRNSWGDSWGEDGYMRLDATSARVGCSVCYMVYQDDGTTAPVLSTNNASSIGDNSATCGGNISSDGGSSITTSGLVYSKTSNPTISTGTVIETSPTTTSGSYSLSIAGLLSGTKYYVKAFATNGKGTSYGSEISFTTTGSTPIEYCTSQGNNYSYEWISNVTIGSFNNNSDAAGYTDFTSLTTNLTAGDSYNISLTPEFSGSTYNEYWKIWIDYNQDGDFDDSNELAYDCGSMSKTTVTGSITIPADQGTVVTRMRVSMKYNAAQTSCESFSYGEVEDYTVSITAGSIDTQAPTAPTNLSSTSITQTSFTLNWTASTDNVGVTAYDIYVNGSLKGSTASTNYNVTGLTASTTYSMTIKAKDASGNVSSASSALNVTTLDPPDTEAPTAPTNLTVSNTTESSISITWAASTDNVAVTEYNIYRNGSFDGATSSTSYTASGLSSATSYNLYVVAKDAAGNISNASSSVNGTTLESQISYCSSQGNNSSYEWIANVEIGTFINTTGAAGYSDYTSQVVTISEGNTSISLTPGFSGSTYNEYWKIWVDLNVDGDFDDAYELVFDAGSMSSSAVSGILVIPTGYNGLVSRMRVSMKYNASQTACESFSYGEVEDYTIVISGEAANIAPVAEANGPYSAYENTPINFSSTGCSDSDGSIVIYYWEFGDGSTSSDENPTHTYSTTGSYTATLTVTDNDGASDYDEATVTITNEGTAGDPVVLVEEGFENGWGLWTDGGGDCSLYTSGTFAYAGNNAADIQDNSGTASSFYLTNGIDIHTPAFTKLSINFYFYAYSMDNSSEDFWVQYFDGSAWYTIETYARTIDFENNTFYEATVEILESNYTFPTDMKIRFMCDASGNSDDVYIDNITITGEYANMFTAPKVSSIEGKFNRNLSWNENIEEDSENLKLTIYPNPASNHVTLECEISEEFNIKVFNLCGIVVKEFKTTDQVSEVNITDLSKGIYVVTMSNNNQILKEKFIKK